MKEKKKLRKEKKQARKQESQKARNIRRFEYTQQLHSIRPHCRPRDKKQWLFLFQE